MTKTLLATAAVLLMTAWAGAQAPTRILTHPKLPARDALERMNLVMAWHTRVKVEGNRDGLFSVQIIPARGNAQLVVQTYAGAVYLFDAENGDLIWKTHVGVPFWMPQGAAFNSHSIFVTRRNMLFALNRANGNQRIFQVDTSTNVVHFGYEMQFAPSATPIADEDTLYASMGNRVNAIDIEPLIPAQPVPVKMKDGKKDGKYVPPPQTEAPVRPTIDSPQPDFYWGYRLAEETTEFSPLVFGDQVSILTTSGTLISVNRFGRKPREELFEFKAIGRVAAAAGQYDEAAYIASDDFNLYAVNMYGGQLLWRHASGAPILRKPEVNDRDVFIAPERIGLRRLERRTGREVWTNRDTSRFLAATPNFVYALNNVGKFHVIDNRRGTTLAMYDLSDWTLPVPNEMTDRIYLAANDGQIICLRNRDNKIPYIMKTPEFLRREEKKEEKKDEEKKEEKAGRALPSPAPVRHLAVETRPGWFLARNPGNDRPTRAAQ